MENSEPSRVKWKAFSICSKIAILLIDQKTYEMGQEDNKMKLKIFSKWNGKFVRSDWLERKKVEHLRRSSVCSGKFPFGPRVPFSFWAITPKYFGWSESTPTQYSSLLWQEVEMSGSTLIEVFGQIVFRLTRSVSQQYSPEDAHYTTEYFNYNTLLRTGREWYEEPVEEIIYQEYSDREATARDFLPCSNLNARLINACSTDEIEEIQSENQRPEDKAMAWKRLRPFAMHTVVNSMYVGALISLFSAVFIGALFTMISYLCYETVQNCQFHPKTSIPLKIQWARTIFDVISCAFLYLWFFSNMLVLFRPYQLMGAKKKLFLVCAFLYFSDALYRVFLQATGISKSFLSTEQIIPLNALFVTSVFWQVYILTNRFCCAHSRRQKLTVFMQVSASSTLPLVLSVIIATLIYPAYIKQNEQGKLIIALFSPLLGVTLKTVARISVHKLWNITHPAYSYVLMAPLYCGAAVIFRVLQADLGSLQSIAVLGIIHGAAEVIERSTMVAIDHICHLIRKRELVPWGSFRNPRSERLMADIAIMSMLFESTAIVSVNGFFYLYRFIYLKNISLFKLLRSFAIFTSVPLVVEWFFTSLSLAIVTRYQNMAVMAVWRRHWKRHILVACINAIPVAIWTSQNLLLVVHARFQESSKQLPCKMPFSWKENELRFPKKQASTHDKTF